MADLQETEAGNAAALPDKAAKGATLDSSTKDIAFCGLVALAEASLVVAGSTGNVALPTMLLVHCGIMLAVTLVLDQRERAGMDSRVLAVAVVTTAVSGPIGAAFSALLGVYLRLRKLNTELLANWYDRIAGHAELDPVEELYERIQAGRTLNPHVDARARFGAILRSGPLDEKQRVLSIITQKYHPGFAGLLQLALRNEDPPIRVQAAAVAARLKENERLKVRQAVTDAENLSPDDVSRRLDIVGRIAGSLAMELLDEQDAASARTLAKEVCRDLTTRQPDDTRAHLQLAFLLMQEKAYDEAAAYLQQLVARGSMAAHAPLKTCLLQRRRFVEAAALAEVLPPVTAPVLPTTQSLLGGAT